MSAWKIESDARFGRTLSPVGDRVEEAAGLDADDLPLRALLPNRLASRHIGPAPAARVRAPEILAVEIPPHLRLAVNQMLDLADETERRAQLLSWMSESGEVNVSSAWKVGSLQSTADDLRKTAKRLLKEMWLEQG